MYLGDRKSQDKEDEAIVYTFGFDAGILNPLLR